MQLLVLVKHTVTAACWLRRAVTSLVWEWVLGMGGLVAWFFAWGGRNCVTRSLVGSGGVCQWWVQCDCMWLPALAPQARGLDGPPGDCPSGMV